MAVNEVIKNVSGDIHHEEVTLSKKERTDFTPGKVGSKAGDMNWPQSFRIPTGTPAFDNESYGPAEVQRTISYKLGRNIISDTILPIPTITGTVVETRNEEEIDGTHTLYKTDTTKNPASVEKKVDTSVIIEPEWILAWVSTGHQLTWIPPTFTVKDGATLEWKNPLGEISVLSQPPIAFFVPNGRYELRCSNWSKITKFSFNNHEVFRPYLVSWGKECGPTSRRMIGVNSLVNAFRGIEIGPTNWDFSKMSEVTNLQTAFSNCVKMVVPPNVGNMVKVTNLVGAFQYTGIVNPPDLSKMTKVTDIWSMFSHCTSLITPPDLSNMPLCTRFDFALEFCPNMVGSLESIFGDFSTLTNVANCMAMCIGSPLLTGKGMSFINAVKNNTNLIYEFCFTDCVNLEDYNSIPEDWKSSV